MHALSQDDIRAILKAAPKHIGCLILLETLEHLKGKYPRQDGENVREMLMRTAKSNENLAAVFECRYSVKDRMPSSEIFFISWIFPGAMLAGVIGMFSFPIFAGTALGWSGWGIAGAALIGDFGGVAAGGCLGALAGAIVVPITAFLRAMKYRRLGKAWLRGLKKIEPLYDDATATPQENDRMQVNMAEMPAKCRSSPIRSSHEAPVKALASDGKYLY